MIIAVQVWVNQELSFWNLSIFM